MATGNINFDQPLRGNLPTSLTILKADPYAFHSETPPLTASKFYDISGYVWNDGVWMDRRRKSFAENGRDVPLNIYELHFESWKKKDDGKSRHQRDMHFFMAFQKHHFIPEIGSSL